MHEQKDVAISRLGAQGDGIVETGGAPIFVPYTLAGELVRISVDRVDGQVRLAQVLEASNYRIAPICRHFGRCGGCAVQHMANAAYEKWKRDLVAAAFQSRGIDPAIKPLISPIGRRRRAAMTARNTPLGVALGFYESGTHDLVDLIECPVLEPSIVAALHGIRNMIAPLIPRSEPARIVVTALNAGLDVALEDVEKKLTGPLLSALARSATELHLARVSINGEIVFGALPAELTFGSASVVVPPGVFIQAVGDAERAMADECVTSIGKAKRIADLFSGIGALTFPAAKKARVAAFDSDPIAIKAMLDAAKRTAGLKPITALRRDLFREPLSPLELNEYDAIIFDPPRAGAEAQSRMIAKCKVDTAIAVSCNPATLARDARILIDGGYKLETVTPIDQFQYSPHIEAVAVFRR